MVYLKAAVFTLFSSDLRYFLTLITEDFFLVFELVLSSFLSAAASLILLLSLA